VRIFRRDIRLDLFLRGINDMGGRWGVEHRTRRDQLYPDLAKQPDISRGEQRLAAEVVLALMDGEPVPAGVAVRADEILRALAQH
jgi:hypothetical protein